MAAVGLLIQALECRKRGPALSASRRAALLVPRHQRVQRLDGLATIALALQHQPLFDLRAVVEGEPCQELALVERDGLLQAPAAGRAQAQVGMGVAGAGLEQRGKEADVDLHVGRGVELHILAGGREQGRLGGGGRAQRSAQRRERLAEALAGVALGIARPQQAGQLFAAVRGALFDGQIGQQRPGLVRAKGGHGPLAEGHPQRPKQRDDQLLHAPTSEPAAIPRSAGQTRASPLPIPYYVIARRKGQGFS